MSKLETDPKAAATFFGAIGQALVAPLSLEDRRKVCDKARRFDHQKLSPDYLLQGLFVNSDAQTMLAEETGRVFGNTVWLDFTGTYDFQLRVSGTAQFPPRSDMSNPFKATEYRATTDKGDIVELWLAKGFGPFMSMPSGNPMMGRGAPPPGWENFVRDGNLFPMRVISHDADGTEKMRMEVTSVEKGPVSDSLFSTEGYSEFQMPDFGGMNPFKR